MLNLYDYQELKCGENACTETSFEEIHYLYKDDDEVIWRAQRIFEELAEEDVDEIDLKYCGGSEEVVKIINQKCVVYFDFPSVFAFRHCDHQRICEIVMQAALGQLTVHKVCMRIQLMKC